LNSTIKENKRREKYKELRGSVYDLHPYVKAQGLHFALIHLIRLHYIRIAFIGELE